MTFNEWLKSVTPEGHTHIAPEDLCAAWNASRREALKEAVRAVEDTDVAKMGSGYLRCDDGRQTLRNAADAVRALAAETPKGTP